MREPGPKGEPYRVVAGYGRLEAANAAKIATVPILVDEFPEEVLREGLLAHKLSRGAAQLLGSMTENIIREDMGAWDVAEGIGALHREGMSPEQIVFVLCEEGGRKALDPRKAREYIQIASLPQSIKARLLPMGKVGFTIARKLVDRPSLKVSGVWLGQDLVEYTDRLIAEEVSLPEEPEPGKSEGIYNPGWRFRSTRGRTVANRMRDAGKCFPWVVVLGYMAGDDSFKAEFEQQLGEENIRLLFGRKLT